MTHRSWLRLLREQKGLTQTALARVMSVSPSVVVRWENGERSPSRANAIALERVLGPEVHVHLTAEELAPPSGEEVA